MVIGDDTFFKLDKFFHELQSFHFPKLFYQLLTRRKNNNNCIKGREQHSCLPPGESKRHYRPGTNAKPFCKHNISMSISRLFFFLLLSCLYESQGFVMQDKLVKMSQEMQQQRRESQHANCAVPVILTAHCPHPSIASTPRLINLLESQLENGTSS